MARLPQAELVRGLTAIVGPQHLSADRPDRIAYSTDFWPKTQIWKMDGDIDRYPPDCIVWPADEAEISAVLRFCHDHQVPVVPYGGGSGVCGGTIPIHGGVVVDVKRLRAVVDIDETSLTVRSQAGINGQHLEDALNARGFTLGHFPSSIMCSTLGGWLAARSAGQFSSRYGKIEDMVVSLRMAVADGTVLDTAERGLGDPDWTQLIVGSEGTLGVITEAELKLHHLPAARRLRAYRFRTVQAGLDGARAVMQAGLRPMVLRLYDPFDSFIALGKERDRAAASDDAPGATAPPKRLNPLAALRARFGGTSAPPPHKSFIERKVRAAMAAVKRSALVGALATPALTNRVAHATPTSCLMIVGFEGPEDAVQSDAWAAAELLTQHGGSDAGVGPGEAWLAHRYAVSFKQTKIFNMGAFADTMEVATTWDRLPTLYESVRRALTPHVFLMAHFSHAYREGCSIYFTFAGFRPDAARLEQLYDRVWTHATDAVLRAGGTVSHHHGVGLAKKGAMVREHGEMLRVWRALKEAVDPHNVMNPDKLFPEPGAETPTSGV